MCGGVPLGTYIKWGKEIKKAAKEGDDHHKIEFYQSLQKALQLDIKAVRELHPFYNEWAP